MSIPAGESRVFVERMDDDRYLDARSFDFTLGEGASLTRIVIQSGGATPLAMARVRLSAGAKLKQFVLAEGAKLSRIETHVSIEGEGADVELNGVYLCDAGRHADLTSVIEHKVGGGQTRQLIKGVAKRGGRGVFQGKIVVAHGAQKTDARQYHHGMLLEDGAEIFAKPELLIHADDVQCAHGNTAGGLDESALFYLRSRGVPEVQARGLLVEAFLAEAIPHGLPQEISDELLGRIRTWLGAAA
jgi:Fe-S cluster assembly protein SufD